MQAVNLVPTGIQSRAVQPVAHSLYRLIYRHTFIYVNIHLINFTSPPTAVFRYIIHCISNVMTLPETNFRLSAKRANPFKLFSVREYGRLLAADVCASEVMMDKSCSEVVWKLLAMHCIYQFPFHFHSFPSPCTITFELECTAANCNTVTLAPQYKHMHYNTHSVFFPVLGVSFTDIWFLQSWIILRVEWPVSHVC